MATVGHAQGYVAESVLRKIHNDLYVLISYFYATFNIGIYLFVVCSE